MAGKGMESDLYGSTFSTESIKVIAESIGIGNLPDDAARELSEDISFRIKHIIQDAAKYMHHAKRTKILASDIDSALKARNLEPQYGFYATEPLPFRFASGGGRELHFIEEKEVDLNELVQNANTKAPLEVTLRSHWLCIDGIQPTIPENPPPLSKESQKLDSVDPVNKLNKPTLESAGKPTLSKQKLRNVETVQIKQLATHELSVEQQIYYKEITEACVGSDEGRRTEALQSLSSDPGLHEMLPRMCTFIIEGVRVNVVQNNLALLIYLMRMVKALLDNQALFLEKYLHELIPSVTTCIVSRQLCMRPELDNHWALRDFASRLMAQICKNFNTSTNNIQTRVTRMFSNALAQGDKLPLSSLYGALEGLSELGTEVIKTFILPRIRAIGDRIMQHLDGPQVSNIDKNASNHIKSLLLKVLAPVIKAIKTPPDYLEEYRNDYGYLGPALQSAVLRARAPPPTSTQNVSMVGGLGCGGVGNVGAGIVGMGGTGAGRVIGVTGGTSSQQQTTILQQTSQQAGRTIMVNQPGGGTRVQTVGSSQVAAGNPKILFLTQRSNPGTQQQQQLPQQPQMVKFVPGTAGVGTSQQTKLISSTAVAAAGGSSSGVVGGIVSSIAASQQQPQQKLMVVSVANTSPGSAPTNVGSNVVINTQSQQQSQQQQQQQIVATEQPPVTVLTKTIFQTKHFPEPQVDDLSHLA